MSDELDRIDKMLNQDQMGQTEEESISAEISEILKVVILGLIIGPLVIYGLGGLASYIVFSSTNNIIEYSSTLAFIIFLPVGLYFVLSFYTGQAVFYGSAMRAAWTGSSVDSDDMKDLQSFISTPKILAILLMGSIVTLLVNYFYFPITY